MTTFNDLLIDHDYYCSESNFYSNDPAMKWDTWADFYEEYIDADIDMNLIFRWDIKKREETNRRYMEVFMIHQRKGIFAPHHIDLVDEQDFDSIKELLNKHYAKLQKIWHPISR